MKKVITLLLLSSALSFGYSARLQSVTQIATFSQRLDACRNGCTTGQELVFDSETGAACSHGGNAYQLWSMSYDGSNKVNLTATHPNLAALTNLNEGNVKFSPNGQWVVFQAQGSTSTIACDNNAANPGAGFDQNVYVCDFPAFAACTQMTHLTIGIGVGTLHPTLNSSFLFWMNIQGVGMTDAGLFGTFRYAAFAIVMGIPTIGTPSNLSPNAPNWFEPAGYNPLSQCTAYYTSGATRSTTQVFPVNMCTSTVNGPVSVLGSSSEFWNVDSTASLSLTMGTQFTPAPIPPSPGTPSTDLYSAASGTGVAPLPLTFYNTPSSPEYIPTTGSGQLVVSHPVWGNGQQYVLWTLQNSAGGTRMPSTIWRANYVPASSYMAGIMNFFKSILGWKSFVGLA